MNSINFGHIAPWIAATYFVMMFLTRFLETEKRMPKLHQILKFAWLWAFLLMAFFSVIGFPIHKYFLEILSLSVLYILYQSKQIQTTRTLFIAIVPYILVVFIVTFLKLLTPKFLSDNSGTLDSMEGFAIAWMIGFGIYAQRQNKRDTLKRHKDEEERLKIEAKKQELEYQVAERTAELTEQKESLVKTLLALKATQTQLIHAEKMASLGELTAGIAHEIQNPLNFVNNFSEVSVELCQEITEELEKPDFDKTYITEILSDLSQNQQKITHHGQRAANIVKGMLQHSRTGTGQKELTDINALADEYLRLSYHGLRAKDKNDSATRFNADFELIADPNLPKIKVIPQDFGRVLLNLINNAFQAPNPQRGLKVVVSTKYIAPSSGAAEGLVIISVADNGTGMSEATKAKIFQPFFTTKPTGQGTGLGLSLAYDIITKGHGGTIECESVEGEGTTFVVKLPLVIVS